MGAIPYATAKITRFCDICKKKNPDGRKLQLFNRLSLSKGAARICVGTGRAAAFLLLASAMVERPSKNAATHRYALHFSTCGLQAARKEIVKPATTHPPSFDFPVLPNSPEEGR